MCKNGKGEEYRLVFFAFVLLRVETTRVITILDLPPVLIVGLLLQLVFFDFLN